MHTHTHTCILFTTRDLSYSNKFLFAEEAHSDVVPELRALWRRGGSHTILGEGNIKVAVILDHRTCSQDGLGVGGIKGQGSAQPLKCPFDLADLEVEEAQRSEKVRVLGIQSVEVVGGIS